MKKIDRRIVIVITLVFMLALAYGLMRYLISLKEEPMKRPQPKVTRYVAADTVKYANLISPVIAPGRMASVSQLDIVSEAAGKIQTGTVPLKKGARFKKGDLLFTIYPDEADLALKARKSQFLTLLVNLIPDIRIDFPDFEKEFLQFYENIDLSKPLPPLPATENIALKNFLSGRSVLSEYYSISRDELSLNRRSIYAPFNGTYTSVYSEVGAYVNTGARVAHAIRTDELELEIPLERFHSEFVKVNDAVTVYSGARNVSWQGKVIRKAEFVDAGTQSQSVFVQVKNPPDQPVLAGEYLSAEFKGQPVDSVMQLNRNAVFNSNEVFVVVDGSLQKRVIDIVKMNEKTLLFRGLDEGSLVVNQPLINVMEGTEVSILGSEPVKKEQKKKQEMAAK